MRRFLPFGGMSLVVGVALAALASLLPMSSRAADKPTLTVYTYDSFVSDWGPGPALKQAFEKRCGCNLNLVGTSDAGALLSRLQLEGSGQADVVLGLDNNQRAQARATGLLAPLPAGLPQPAIPGQWQDDTFMPVDWGWFAFVYDRTRLKNPPHSFKQLLQGHYRVVIEDPRTSTPGLGLLLWVRELYGDQAPQAWRQLRPQIVTVAQSWTDAYNLFLKGEADLALSYTTSPAYHQMEEHKQQYAAAIFDEGQPVQVEVAAKVKNGPHPRLADAFLHFLTSHAAQKLMATGNWMYPAFDSGKPLPDAFKALPRPAHTLMLSPETIASHKSRWLREWQGAMSY